MTTRKHITLQDIKNAAPGAIAWELPDSRAPGLVLKIAPSGVKTWVIRYTPIGAAGTIKSWAHIPP